MIDNVARGMATAASVAIREEIDELRGYATDPSWRTIKNIIASGHGGHYFPTGYVFSTQNAINNTDILWRVAAHDHFTAADVSVQHNMALEMKYAYSAANGSYVPIQFSAPQALYYAAEELSAGEYSFVFDYSYSGIAAGTYGFTIAQPVPAGGQICISPLTDYTAITNHTISTYASVGATTAIENGIAIVSGASGTSLGTCGTGDLCHPHRIIWGSNNYAQSAARQLLNSDAAAGSVWQPATKFDRPPAWATTQAGFMAVLPVDLVNVLQTASIPCRANNVYECDGLDGAVYNIGGTYTLQDKVFLPSRPEIYGNYDANALQDGASLDIYDDAIDAERILYDRAGAARYSWLRSPNPSYASIERLVHTSGVLYYNYALNALAVAPLVLIG